MDCAHCKKIRRISWYVTDRTWKNVVPEKFSKTKLCMECFLYFCERFNYKLRKDDLEWLYFGCVVWVDNKDEAPTFR